MVLRKKRRQAIVILPILFVVQYLEDENVDTRPDLDKHEDCSTAGAPWRKQTNKKKRKKINFFSPV